MNKAKNNKMKKVMMKGNNRKVINQKVRKAINLKLNLIRNTVKKARNQINQKSQKNQIIQKIRKNNQKKMKKIQKEMNKMKVKLKIVKAATVQIKNEIEKCRRGVRAKEQKMLKIIKIDKMRQINQVQGLTVRDKKVKVQGKKAEKVLRHLKKRKIMNKIVKNRTIRRQKLSKKMKKVKMNNWRADKN